MLWAMSSKTPILSGAVPMIYSQQYVAYLWSSHLTFFMMHFFSEGDILTVTIKTEIFLKTEILCIDEQKYEVV